MSKSILAVISIALLMTAVACTSTSEQMTDSASAMPSEQAPTQEPETDMLSETSTETPSETGPTELAQNDSTMPPESTPSPVESLGSSSSGLGR